MQTVKLQTLWWNFKSSSIKDKESLDAYSTKLSAIVNQIRKYSGEVSEHNVIEKILRSLPKKYEHIVVTIEEANDFMQADCG